MEQIELFVQAEGRDSIGIITIPPTATIADVLAAAKAARLISDDGGALLSLEDADEPVDGSVLLSDAGISQHAHIHLHRRTRVEAKVIYNGRTLLREFPPAATVRRVKRWAVGPDGFQLDSAAAKSHVLEIAGSDVRPPEETHLGTLVKSPATCVTFNLVPKVRVEG